MARLCVRVVANDHPTDAKLTPLRTGIGDVVCITEDGHKFSHCELNNGQYRIIDMPGVAPEKVGYLCDHVEAEDGTLLKRRAVTLDKVQLFGPVWGAKTTATEVEVSAIVIATPALVSDPIIDVVKL